MFLPEAQSRAQALEYGTHHRRIDMAFQTDPNTPRQLNTNRARTRRRSLNPDPAACKARAPQLRAPAATVLHGPLSLQVDQPHASRHLEHVVGVDAVLHRYTSDRRARLRRLLHDQPALVSTPSPTRRPNDNPPACTTSAMNTSSRNQSTPHTRPTPRAYSVPACP